jgi:hypothetical protein
LTAISGLSPSNDDFLQRKAGAWTNRTPAQAKTDLALTKSDVGLSSVDNTADTAKPVSTAQQTALDLKGDKANLVYVIDHGSTAGTARPAGASSYAYVRWRGTVEPTNWVAGDEWVDTS